MGGGGQVSTWTRMSRERTKFAVFFSVCTRGPLRIDCFCSPSHKCCTFLCRVLHAHYAPDALNTSDASSLASPKTFPLYVSATNSVLPPSRCHGRSVTTLHLPFTTQTHHPLARLSCPNPHNLTSLASASSPSPPRFPSPSKLLPYPSFLSFSQRPFRHRSTSL